MIMWQRNSFAMTVAVIVPFLLPAFVRSLKCSSCRSTTVISRSARRGCSALSSPPTSSVQPQSSPPHGTCSPRSGALFSAAAAGPDLAFTPSDPGVDVDFDWRALSRDVFGNGDTRPIILFDGICNFCNGGVTKCLDLDPQGKFRYASLQSQVGQSLLIRSGKKHNDISSIVLVTQDQAYFHSDAILRIGQKLKGLPNSVRAAASASRTVLPRFVRDAAYNFVAKNRYVFGENEGETCRVDLDPALLERFIGDPVINKNKDEDAKKQ